MIFEIVFRKKSYRVVTNLLGEHNVYNILSAISVSLYLGISISKAIQSLKSFYGASRRFDIYKNIKINNYAPIVIDDYGHHPTEIKSTIKTIKKIYPNKKTIMIFQPHRFSRTKAYWISFVETLKSLDHIILLPTYSAGERNNSYDSSFLYKEIKNKNKSILKSIQNINKALTSLDFTNLFSSCKELEM